MTEMDFLGRSNEFQILAKDKQVTQIFGVVNAYTALLAKKSGAKAIYLSGAGVANAVFAKPDLGLTSLSEVCSEVSKISQSCDLPLLVDADTGWGNHLNASHATEQLILAGASAMHIEDQTWPKRCGHRDGKSVIDSSEMCQKISACRVVANNLNEKFTVMARTDAVAVEGIDSAIDRCKKYIDSGANMIFAESLQSLEEYHQFTKSLDVPVLANITEFGKTPLFTIDELRSVDIKLALYPLSGFRAMSKAYINTVSTIIQHGTQKDCIDTMQTREELYSVLNYHEFESKL